MNASENVAADARPLVVNAEPGNVVGRRSEALTLVLLLLATTLVRLAVILARWDQFDADPDGYRLIAESLANSGIYGRPLGGPDSGGPLFATAYRPPLYPLILSTFVRKGQVPHAAVATLHVFAALATVTCVYRLGCNLGLGRAATLAAFGVACDPILLNQSTLVMTETLAAFFVAFTLYLGERLSRRRDFKHAFSLGAALGVAALCRPTFLPFAGLAVIGCLFLAAPRGRRLGLATCMAIAVLLSVSPWIVRNQRVFDRWIATTTHGGYTLLLGNNPDFYQHLAAAPRGEPWLLPTDDYLMEQCRELHSEMVAPRINLSGSEQELFDDALAYYCAREHIHAHPEQFVRACFYRVGQFWNPLPHAMSEEESTSRAVVRWSIAVWYVAIYSAIVVTIWQRRHLLGRRPWRQRGSFPWLLLILVVFSFAAAHVTYWSNLRMRGPIMPALYLLAASALVGGTTPRPPAPET